jgi:hypothetical protein
MSNGSEQRFPIFTCVGLIQAGLLLPEHRKEMSDLPFDQAAILADAVAHPNWRLGARSVLDAQLPASLEHLRQADSFNSTVTITPSTASATEHGGTAAANQAMQLTASKPAIYAPGVCHPHADFICAFSRARGS